MGLILTVAGLIGLAIVFPPIIFVYMVLAGLAIMSD